MKNNDDIFIFDDAFQDGVYIVPSKCRYNMRKVFEKRIELGRELTEEEMKEFSIKE